jgi:hypothetical protein
MARSRPPLAAVVRFIGGIDRGDLEGLGRRMTTERAGGALDRAWPGSDRALQRCAAPGPRISYRGGMRDRRGWRAGR